MSILEKHKFLETNAMALLIGAFVVVTIGGIVEIVPLFYLENTIEKVFHHPSKVTVVEAREAQKAGRDAEAVFYDKWVEKNKGVTRNKAKGASGNGGNSGRPGGGAPQAGGGQQKKTNSLFGGNK